MALNPKLSQNIAAEQPVQAAPNPSSVVFESVTGLLGGLNTNRSQPRESDIKNQSLRPMFDEFSKIDSMALSPQERNRRKLGVARQYISQYPAYTQTITGAVSGVTGRDFEDLDFGDSLVSSFEDALRSGDQNAAFSIVLDSEGNIDLEQSTIKFMENNAQDAALDLKAQKLNLERSQLALDADLSSAEKRERDKADEEAINTFINATSEEASTTLVGMITNLGAAGIQDLPQEEVIQTLERAKLFTTQKLRNRLTQAGLTNKVTEEEINRAVAPFNDALSMVEKHGQAYVDALKSAVAHHKLNVVNLVGAAAAYEDAIVAFLLNDMTPEQRNTMLKGFSNLDSEPTLGRDIFLSPPQTPEEAATEKTVAPEEWQNLSSGEITDIVEGAVTMVEIGQDIPLGLGRLYAVSNAKGMAISRETAAKVFSGSGLANIVKESRGDTGDAASIRSSFFGYGADQLRFITAAINSMVKPDVNLTTIDGELVATDRQGNIVEGNDKMRNLIDSYNLIRTALPQVPGGEQVVNKLNLEFDGVSITTNKDMKPLFTAEGASPRTFAYAPEHMSTILRGPFSKAQKLFGKPIVINDAIAKEGTTREKNTPGSMHFHGEAIDVSIAGMTDEEKLRLHQAFMDAGFTGFGFGRNILHVDVGKPRVWAYGNTKWAGLPIEEVYGITKGQLPAASPITFQKADILGVTLPENKGNEPEVDPHEGAPTNFLDFSIPENVSAQTEAPKQPPLEQAVELLQNADSGVDVQQDDASAKATLEKAQRVISQMLENIDKKTGK